MIAYHADGTPEGQEPLTWRLVYAEMAKERGQDGDRSIYRLDDLHRQCVMCGEAFTHRPGKRRITCNDACHTASKARKAKPPRERTFQPAMPLIEEKGWRVGQALTAGRWREPRVILAFRDGAVRMGGYTDKSSRRQWWVKSMPVDVEAA